MRCEPPAPRSTPWSLFSLNGNESLPTGLPVGVTPAMLSFAANTSLAVETPQIVIAAFLGGANNTHRAGSFEDAAKFLDRARRRQSSARTLFVRKLLEQHVGQFLARSSGLCGAPLTKLHIVHDLNLGDQAALLDTHAGRVVFHEVQENSQVLGNDWRFAHFYHILQRSKAWECAWAVDLTDVGVIQMPPCSILPERSLVTAADGQTKDWIRAAGVNTRLNMTWSLNFSNFLRRSHLRPFSCSIVGGRRAAFLPALREVAKRLGQHRTFLAEIGKQSVESVQNIYVATTLPIELPQLLQHAGETQRIFKPGADMIIWNQVAIESGRVLTGYPMGPTNVPYMGNVEKVDAHLGCCAPPEVVNWYHLCKLNWRNATRKLYWFGHKLPSTWWADYLQWEPSCLQNGSAPDG